MFNVDEVNKVNSSSVSASVQQILEVEMFGVVDRKVNIPVSSHQNMENSGRHATNQKIKILRSINTNCLMASQDFEPKESSSQHCDMEGRLPIVDDTSPHCCTEMCDLMPELHYLLLNDPVLKRCQGYLQEASYKYEERQSMSYNEPETDIVVQSWKRLLTVHSPSLLWDLIIDCRDSLRDIDILKRKGLEPGDCSIKLVKALFNLSTKDKSERFAVGSTIGFLYSKVFPYLELSKTKERELYKNARKLCELVKQRDYRSGYTTLDPKSVPGKLKAAKNAAISRNSAENNNNHPCQVFPQVRGSLYGTSLNTSNVPSPVLGAAISSTKQSGVHLRDANEVSQAVSMLEQAQVQLSQMPASEIGTSPNTSNVPSPVSGAVFSSKKKPGVYVRDVNEVSKVDSFSGDLRTKEHWKGPYGTDEYYVFLPNHWVEDSDDEDQEPVVAENGASPNTSFVPSPASGAAFHFESNFGFHQRDVNEVSKAASTSRHEQDHPRSDSEFDLCETDECDKLPLENWIDDVYDEH